MFAVLASSSFEVPQRGAWSPGHDAELATIAARKLAHPELHRALEELHLLGEDREQLWGYAMLTQARRFAAGGTTRAQFAKLHPGATGEQLAVFAQPAEQSDGELLLIESLARARHAATEPSAAELAHRGPPTPGTAAAAQVIQAALDKGDLRRDELLAAAAALALGQTPLVPPAYEIPRRSPELDVLAARLCDATLRTGRSVGAGFALVRTCDVDLPLVLAPPSEEFQIFAILVGPRLLLMLLFRGAMPRWTSSVSATEPGPLALRQPEGTLVLPPLDPADPLAAARAVAGLRSYLIQTLEAHLAANPGDLELFPVLEDAHLERLFS